MGGFRAKVFGFSIPENQFVITEIKIPNKRANFRKNKYNRILRALVIDDESLARKELNHLLKPTGKCRSIGEAVNVGMMQRKNRTIKP